MESRVKRRRLNPKDASESEDEQSPINSEESSAGEASNDENVSSDEEVSEEDEERSDDEDDIIQKELAEVDFATLAKAQKSLSGKPTASLQKSKPPHPEPKSHPRSPTTEPSKPKSKNAPQEVSSKRPVSRKRFLPTSQPPSRDPRFETLSTPTNVSSSTLRASYAFIEEYQRDEISLLKTQIRNSRDPDVKTQLEKTLQSLQSRRDARAAKDRAEGVLQRRKREEREKIKQGKRPYYLKKKEEKKLVLEERYSGLGKKKLEKVLEKKRKKKEGKEMRKMPRQR